MKKVLLVILGILAVLALVVLVGPFLVPISPLEGLEPPEALADENSRFMTVPFEGTDGITLHYRQAGEGEPSFVLLHGFSSNIYTWDEVFDTFAAQGRTLAYDRPPFGLSERLVEGDWAGDNPYAPDAAVDQLIAFMDANGIDKTTLVGNSAGGTVALRAALAYPERIESLILISPAVYTGGGAPPFLQPFVGTPQFQRIGPLVSRQFAALGDSLAGQSYHDPGRITPEQAEKAQIATRVERWDEALWAFTAASQESDLAQRLDEVVIPVLVITGDDDRIVPTEESIRLADELPNAQLVVVEACGHVAHAECPAETIQAIKDWLNQ